MATYLSCTIIRKDEEEENGIEIVADYGVGHEPFTYAPTSEKAALLCDRFEGINFKPCNGHYPGTWKQGHECMAFSEPGFSVRTTEPGQRNRTWYTVLELHELIQTTPEAEGILGKAFVAGVYKLLEEDPATIIQFSCDQ
jgi:hypothetical protein